MTTHNPQASARHQIVRASQADTGVLAGVIAEAFFPLAVCEWLIPDPAARRAAFPGYFRMYVEHAMADGLVHTTLGRDAAALWIPLGTQLPAPPGGYGEHLAEITGPWVQRFTVFDAELDAHHLTGLAHHHPGHCCRAPGPARPGHRHRPAARPPRRPRPERHRGLPGGI
jgi:hypothetical protein